jgi:transcriptional regulator with XRE-family HTH domain
VRAVLGAKRARIEAGFTLRAAAMELRVSLVSLWRWEAGKHIPPVEKIQELARLYGCSVRRIMKAPKPTRYDMRKSEARAVRQEPADALQGGMQDES